MSTIIHRLTRTLPRQRSVKQIVRALFNGLRQILVLLVIILTILPVAMLLISTAVPKSILVVFIVVDVALIVALFHLRTLHQMLAVLAGFVTIALCAIIASQAFASTPTILDTNGQPLPHSIAVLEKVRLGGTEQWITIRGKNVNRPVLLFLAGGPGGSELVWTRKYLAKLEDHFVVVNWDQPGAGKSYNAVPIASLTPERYVLDAHELLQMLRSRFDQNKIYVLGESWGSILGIKLVQKYPDLFYAYIGSGQMVNTTKNDVMGYVFAIKQAINRGDHKTVESLQRNGSPPYLGDGMFMKYTAYMMALNNYMYAQAAGEGTDGNRILDLLGTEYGLIDKVNWFRGLIDGFTVVYPQLADLDFTTQANQLNVPVYFVVGRWDVNAMASLVERYYTGLQAPHKELIWFEKSGHTPIYEEPNKFVDVMVKRVLAQTQPAS